MLLSPQHDVEIKIQQEKRIILQPVRSYLLGYREAANVNDAPTVCSVSDNAGAEESTAATSRPDSRWGLPGETYRWPRKFSASLQSSSPESGQLPG